MHLAYLDESGTDGFSPVVMFGAVIVSPGKFGHVEGLHSAAIQQILPVERAGEFKEFHARDLYLGEGPFEGIDQKKRFTAIQVLLTTVMADELPFIYAAVDRKKFRDSPFGSGSPLNAAFHLCLLGVEDWARSNHRNPSGIGVQIDFKDTCLYILDDCDDRQLKDRLRGTYRTLRTRRPFLPPHENRLWHAHDDMYFGDSKDSVGIQLADLCNYFVRRRICNEPEPENFYDIIAQQVRYARPEPEWTTYRDLFRIHEAQQ